MKKKAPAKKSDKKLLPVVGIGASAGGMEAMIELLRALPPDTGMAYVFIQHLDPTHESMLATIFSKATSMQVFEAKNLMPIAADTLYIIPPNKDMAIVDGVLTLKGRKPKPAVHMPIDQFFLSLAERQKETAIGILLSGTAHDGTYGLKSIKIAGGVTIVQDESAKFHSMPKSAIAEGVVDLVLSPKEIAKELQRLSKQKDIIQEFLRTPEQSIPNTDEHLNSIIQMLKRVNGVDFSHYKMNTIKRRIVRRMLLYKVGSLKDYAQYLRQHVNEMNVLYQDLLISVTTFFRDPDAMEYLKKTLFSRIIKSKVPNESIRIWIPACSTGEEAFSIAMIVTEILGEKIATTPVQIFATDLSEMAITKARLGLYNRNELVNVSPKRLQRFFVKIDGGFRIVKSIRDMCVFAPHNVFKDPPFSRIDFISCCNLLIYLDIVLQKKILATFHYSLNNNGYLMLGKSETIGASTALFAQLEKKYKIYSKKKGAAASAMFEMNYRVPDIDRREAGTPSKSPQKMVHAIVSDLERTVDGILLDRYIPACVVVNHDLEILQFRGSTSMFLEPSPGKASLNLLKMARAGLGFELRNSVHKALRSSQTVRKEGLEIKISGAAHQVAIEVVPLNTDTEERLFLVIFEETILPGSQIKSVSKDKLVKQLQDELKVVKEDMRSIIEEQEASNEELQSANEEIVSSNEELQSINEELETSKEEVESTNEELMTINTELQVRNEQLAEAYEYSEAVFGTIREAVLVLDKALRIKSANHAFYKTFNEKVEDTEGMLIYELSHHQWDIPLLRQLLEDILAHNTVVEGFEVTHSFGALGEKVLLLNARQVIQKAHPQRIVLLVIEDVTENRKGTKIIAEREAMFRNMADNAPVMIWMSNRKRQRTFFNKTWLAYTGRTLEDEVNSGWAANIHPEDLNKFLQIYDTSFENESPFQVECRLKRYDKNFRWTLGGGKPTYGEEGVFTGFIGTFTEIHDQRIINEDLEKRVEQRTRDLQEMNKEFERSNNELQQFAYVASHDLQEPLRKIMSFADRLQKFKSDFPDPASAYIEKIVSSSNRMTRLIDDLLNFSRIAKASDKFVKTDLNAVMKDLISDFEIIIKEKQAKINYDKLPTIKAVPLQMEQLFHNLLSNALKFSKDEKQPVVDISCENPSTDEIERLNLDQKLKYIKIEFKDNGIGFDSRFAEQIFVIFQRLNDKKIYPGTGIGLALCRKIVNYHNGEMYANSQNGKGATFFVILPLVQAT